MGTAMLYGTVLLLVVLLSTSVNGDRDLYVFALPVGQGDATIIKCPDTEEPGKLTIIDMGYSSCVVGNCMGKEEIKNFIGNHKLEYIFVTHPDMDHYNLLPALYDNVDANVRLYHSCAKKDYTYSKKNPLDDIKSKIEFVRRIKKFDCTKGGPTYTICEGKAFIHVIASELGNSCVKRPNEASLVLQLEYNDQTVLFVGDLDGEAVNEVIKCYIESDALRLAHHGSRERGANSNKFLKRVNADIAIVSSDPERQGFKHPSCEIFKWYKKNKGKGRGPGHDIVCIDAKGEIVTKDKYWGGIWSTTAKSSKPTANYRSKIIDLKVSGASSRTRIAPSHKNPRRTLLELAPFQKQERKQGDDDDESDDESDDDDERKSGADDDDESESERDEDGDLHVRKNRYHCKLCRKPYRFKHTHLGVDYMVPL